MPAPDYQSLIDAATWGFIRDSEASYPPDTASLTIADQRRIYDAMCAKFHRGYPAGVVAEDRVIAGVACRIYPGQVLDSAPTVVYLHGGGYVVGGLHSHDDVCADIRAATGLQVVAVDYRLSPEHLHPAAFDDARARGAGAVPGRWCWWAIRRAAILRLRSVMRCEVEARILGQVLIYPGLGGDRSKGSYQTHAFAPMLTLADVEFYAGIRHGGVEVRGDANGCPFAGQRFQRPAADCGHCRRM